MKILDNISDLLGDDLKVEIRTGERLSLCAATFSIHAYAALDEVLRGSGAIEFIFTGPSFVTDGGGTRAAHREFLIPAAMDRRDVAGTPFEIRLRNRLGSRSSSMATQRDCSTSG